MHVALHSAVGRSVPGCTSLQRIPSMSRPPTVSQLLKRAGLAKRPRPIRQSEASLTAAEPGETISIGSGSTGRKATNTGKSGGNLSLATEKQQAKDDDDRVDDRIAALERELEGDGGSDSDADSSSSSESTDSDDNHDGDNYDECSGNDDEPAGGRSRNRLLKLVSPLQAEKIQPLPAHLLPHPGCGVSKSSKPKKAKRPRDTEGSGPRPSNGLDGAVKELLANYEARSSERVPFYCRVCKFQGERCSLTPVCFVGNLCGCFCSVVMFSSLYYNTNPIPTVQFSFIQKSVCRRANG